MLPETALQVGRHSLYHCGRAGLISPVNVPNTTATLHSENRYLDGKAIFLISKTHIPRRQSRILMPSLENPFEENRQNPPEEEGELGNS